MKDRKNHGCFRPKKAWPVKFSFGRINKEVNEVNNGAHSASLPRENSFETVEEMLFSVDRWGN